MTERARVGIGAPDHGPHLPDPFTSLHPQRAPTPTRPMRIASPHRSTGRRARALWPLALVGVLTVVSVRARAQQPAVTATDGALLARVLLAEARHDTGSAALADGMRSADARIRAITLRARARLRDAALAGRDSLPSVPAAPSYPDPAWRPHGTTQTGNPDLQPIWLTTEDEAPNGAKFLFLIDNTTANLAPYTRVFDLFDGNDEPAVTAARERWKSAKSDGHTLAYWQQTARGWQKKA